MKIRQKEKANEESTRMEKEEGRKERGREKKRAERVILSGLAPFLARMPLNNEKASQNVQILLFCVF